MKTQELHKFIVNSTCRLKACYTDSDIKLCFTEIIVALGFSQFAYNRYYSATGMVPTTLHTCLDEWRSLYREQKYFEIDPILEKAKSSSDPFIWGASDFETDDERRALYQTSSGFGLGWGVTIPLRASSKEFAFLSYFGPGEAYAGEKLTAEQLTACCRVLSETFHQTLLSIHGNTPLTLKTREKEVLSLSALGMSGCEIAAIIGVSPIYVAEISRAITQKLGVRNKLSALNRARELGLLGRASQSFH